MRELSYGLTFLHNYIPFPNLTIKIGNIHPWILEQLTGQTSVFEVQFSPASAVLDLAHFARSANDVFVREECFE